MKGITLAAIQTGGSSDKSANIVQALALVDRAAAAGAEMAVLPENVDWIGPDDGFGMNAEELEGPTMRGFQEAARRNRISLVAGSISEAIDGSNKVHNTSVAINEDGDIVAVYRKIHMFDVSIGDHVNETESDYVEAGRDIVVADLADTRVGMSVCYDLRFPELYRAMADKGADIMVVPAAWYMFTGKDHWEVLLRARAIENQCFVVGACMSGRHPAGVAFGRSMVVNPWGLVLALAQDGPGLALAHADFEDMARIRRELPALASRRLRETVAVGA